MPSDATRCDEALRKAVVRPVDEARGLTKPFRSGECVSHSCLVVAVVVEGVRGLTLVNISDLIERLPQRAHPRGQVTDHAIHLGGLIEAPARVSEPAQGFGCLGRIGSRVEERGHGDLLVPCDGEVRTIVRKMSVVRPSL